MLWYWNNLDIAAILKSSLKNTEDNTKKMFHILKKNEERLETNYNNALKFLRNENNIESSQPTSSKLPTNTYIDNDNIK